MTDGVTERLTALEEAVRRAGDALVRIRDENQRLKAELERLQGERRQSLAQIDAMLKDIAKLDLG